MIRNAKMIMMLALIALTADRVTADGLLQRSSDQVFLPLSRTIVDVQIIDQIALTSVTHEFINTGDSDSLDVLYMFPLPEGAAVTSLAVWRDSLFAEFRLAAADSGGGNNSLPGGSDNSDLTNYLGRNPLVVPMEVTRDTIRLRLNYATLLPYDFGAIQYYFPLNSGIFATGPLDAFAIFLTFATHRTIQDIRTPGFSSGIDITGAFSATVGYDAAAYLTASDFVVDYRLAQEEVGLFTLTHNDPADTTEDAGFFVSLLEPGNVQPNEVLNKHFTFVVDRSGSMAGIKIDQAKSAAVYSIEHLNSEDFFNIIDFATDVRQFRNEAVAATPANVSQAVAYINQIQATGSTNINGSLMAALGQSIPDEVNQVIFLTDGQATAGITATDDILANVRAANENSASIFVFGVGSGVAKDLLQSLADENHGVATYITENQPIDDVIVNFFARISNPVLVEVSLAFGQMEVFDIYPVQLPDMFAGFQQVIAGRYAGAGLTDITLRGKVATADTALVYRDVAFPEANPDNLFIPKIWAKKKIDHLYARWLKEGEPETLRDQIIAISLKYGVLSPFTEFDRPDDPVTSVDGVWLADAGAKTERDAGRAVVVLQWSLAGRIAEVQAIEVFRKRGSGFEKIAVLQPGDFRFVDAGTDPEHGQLYRIELILANGERVRHEIRYAPQSVRTFTLGQNYPNPFNPSTKITFFLREKQSAKLGIYNLAGSQVKVLIDEPLQAGSHEVSWDSRDERGRPVASGIYFYRLETASFEKTRRMVLAR